MGFNPEEYVGQHIQSIIGIDTVHRLLPKFEMVLQGKTLSYEEHVSMTNGEDRFFNVFMAPDIQEEGDIIGFYVCTVDKTERWEAERELAISEERYRSLLLNSGDAFCFHRITGEILDVNVFATTLLGYSREELLSMRINQIDFNWNTPLYLHRLEKVISDTPITIETLVYRKDGTPIPVEVRFVKRIEHGQLMVQALVRNRTDKYEQEQLLRKSEERLRILIENVDDIIITLDWEGTILSINKTQQGHSLKETIGSNVYVGMEEDVKERMKKCMLVAKETGQAFELLHRHRGPDGTIEWYLTHYCPVQGGQMLVCVSRIITHLKESELQIMNGMTLGQEQERKRLGAELHDGVGQILSAISLELSQMGKSLSSIEETQSQLVELNNRVTEAIHEVRNISHDLMPSVLESFGLEEAIREVCRNMQERTGIKIQFNPIDLQPKYFESIETHVYRISQELILNGVKHAHCSEMYVSLIDDEDVISLTVEDDGIGFDTSISSNGIGLKNVKSRVSILRGTLSVESSNTSGTFIHVELPKL
jgi:PAS domain S-box-containing protein